MSSSTTDGSRIAARSVYQWMSKSVIGWAKLLAAGSEKIDAGHGIHYKAPFELLRIDPKAILRNQILMRMPATPPRGCMTRSVIEAVP